MNRDTASHILTNLRERAEQSNSPVVLTSLEVGALQVLYGEPASQPDAEIRESDAGGSDKVAHSILLGEPFRWIPEEKPPSDLIMCLDFGTSYSKASAFRIGDVNNVPELIDISFGDDIDESMQYFLPSELFVHQEFIYFGKAARRQFEVVEAEQDRLKDSPKQYMTLGTEVAELHRKPLRREQDPSETLSQRDALVLYLAHLNYLAESSLEKSGFSRNVRRRYTHPAWDETTKGANSKAMERIMAEAIAVGNLLSSSIEERMPFGEAVAIAWKARGANGADLPLHLLIEPVHEATAAGAGALMATSEATLERHRQPYVILDIGAGTTDVSGCICVRLPTEDRVRVFEVAGARNAILRAGNTIDNILLKEILERSSAAHGTEYYHRLSQNLRREIRKYKETLFDDGNLIAPLKSGETVEISLENFIQTAAMADLFNQIVEIVTDATFKVAGDDGPVILVPTGGGANLPVVQNLTSDLIRKNSDRMKLGMRDAMPDDLKEAYPRLVNVYPQLAVAVGGSHPRLPEQRDSLSEGVRDPGPTTLQPVYRS